MGSVDVRYDNKNPAELYPNTTWELLTSGKYIQTGNTALQQGGSNSISISKANLPNIKLKVDTFSLTIQPHTHNLKKTKNGFFANWNDASGYAAISINLQHENGTVDTSSNGSTNTGSASPSTESLGSGTALSIQPAYITLKFWKRLT